MNCGKIIYNVGHCTCNSNNPKTVTRVLRVGWRIENTATVALSQLTGRENAVYFHYFSSKFLLLVFALFAVVASCVSRVCDLHLAARVGVSATMAHLHHFAAFRSFTPCCLQGCRGRLVKNT